MEDKVNTETKVYWDHVAECEDCADGFDCIDRCRLLVDAICADRKRYFEAGRAAQKSEASCG